MPSVQQRLLDFIGIVEASDDLLTRLEATTDESERTTLRRAATYYEAARSASNDVGPRSTRIKILHDFISGTQTDPIRQNDCTTEAC